MLSLEDDMQVVGSETDGLRAVNSALRLQPDVVVLDISLPGCSGLTAIQAIRQKLTSQRILILTVSEQIEDLHRALQYGAQGYILKRDSIRDIVKAVRSTAGGEIVISNRLLLRLIAGFRRNPSDWENMEALDRQILQLCESGLALTSIAERLCIPEPKVRSSLQIFLAMIRLRLQNAVPSVQVKDFSRRKEE
jgi:two-component system, NarL family, nitrate/nitrite response regulator NarL